MQIKNIHYNIPNQDKSVSYNVQNQENVYYMIHNPNDSGDFIETDSEVEAEIIYSLIQSTSYKQVQEMICAIEALK